jgi:hypothetical protein
MLAADGFLLAAGMDIFLIAVLVGATSYLPAQYAIGGEAPTPPWVELLSAVVMGLLYVVGPLLVWRLRGRRIDVRIAAAMAVGAVAGTALALPALAGVGMLLQRLFGAGANEPPWFAFGALGIVAFAFALLPLVEAVRDLVRKPPHHRTLDWLRVAAFVALFTLGVVVFPLIGTAGDGEAAEAGVFAILFGASAAFAVTAGNIVYRRRDMAGAREAPTPEQA